MRICVYGAGAVGGYLAARLLESTDAEVSIVARGAHLAAVRDRGLELRVRDGGSEVHRPLIATDDPRHLPDQDMVLVTLKVHSLPATAAGIASLLGEDSTVVFFNNGIPWWWHYGQPTVDSGTLPLIDPGGELWSVVRPERVLGGIVYSSNEVSDPGVVTHKGSNRWVVGEPDGSDSQRLRTTTDLMSQAGLNTEASHEIRRDVWEKLLLNLTSAPLATLTRLYSSELHADEELHDLQRNVYEECAAIPAAAGIAIDKAYEEIPVPPERSRPSMLQDVLAGRPIEVEAMLGQPHSFGRDWGVSTPTLDVILPLVRGLDKAMRLGIG